MEISRRIFAKGLAAAVAATAATSRVIAAEPSVPLPNIVFAHGLFADGSCWSDVIMRLQASGYKCTSVQNPLTSFAEATDAVERVLGRQEGPTVLVGHSFAGMLVTQCGNHPLVQALVYIAARAPDAGEDYAALAARFPAPPASAGIIFDKDEGRLSEEAYLRDFAGDLPEARARLLHAMQMPFNRALLSARVTTAAWRNKPSFYAVSARDRTIDPDLQRLMAQRMEARTVELEASHLSLVSQPDAVTELIVRAAAQAGVQRS